MAALRCALASIGHCPRPDDLMDEREAHLWTDFEVFSYYHPECCENPDCSDGDRG